MDPEAGAVDRLAEDGQRGQEEERDRAEPEQVLVALERAVVVAQQQERRREGRDADHDPEALAERVGRVEPVDLRHADRGQQGGDREQVRVGVRDGVARDEVRGEVEREEEQRVGERRRRDLRLPRDVDAREADRR